MAHHQTANFYRSSQTQFPVHLAPRPGGPPESYPPQVSPLLTPNGSFETLRNFTPSPYAPRPTLPTSHPYYATGTSAFSDQVMPMQHVELLRQMWAPTGMQCPTPPEVDGEIWSKTAKMPSENCSAMKKQGFLMLR
jgi:hypothetical protein